ncbi:MAG: hypothetical protein VKL42_04375 [Snowella sp.]|nr:hypothetical protein [Snowella sp.]
MTTKALSRNPYSFDAFTKFTNKNSLYQKRKSIVSNYDSSKTTKGINRQQAVRGLLAILEEFDYPNSDNAEKAIVGQEVRNFLLEKVDGSLPKSINKKTIKVENDFSESQVDEDLTGYYEQSESPEIIESFLRVVKSMPIINEKYDSIYSDEELDEL